MNTLHYWSVLSLLLPGDKCSDVLQSDPDQISPLKLHTTQKDLRQSLLIFYLCLLSLKHSQQRKIVFGEENSIERSGLSGSVCGIGSNNIYERD